MSVVFGTFPNLNDGSVGSNYQKHFLVVINISNTVKVCHLKSASKAAMNAGHSGWIIIITYVTIQSSMISDIIVMQGSFGPQISM